jgi:hypothetical protein
MKLSQKEFDVLTTAQTEDDLFGVFLNEEQVVKTQRARKRTGGSVLFHFVADVDKNLRFMPIVLLWHAIRRGDRRDVAILLNLSDSIIKENSIWIPHLQPGDPGYSRNYGSYALSNPQECIELIQSTLNQE